MESCSVSVSCGGRVGRMRSASISGITVYFVTSVIAFCGVCFGHYLLKTDRPCSLWDSLARMDAVHYASIVADGYSFDPFRKSEVAFFPVYPIASWLVGAVGRVNPRMATLLTANAFLVGSFVVLARYMRAREFPTEHSIPSGSYFTAKARRFQMRNSLNGGDPLNVSNGGDCLTNQTLMAFGLLPFTFFFRMAYSESTFLFFCILAFYAMERQWPLSAIALLVGLTTACRPVGVALITPFLMCVRRRSDVRWKAVVRGAAMLPIAGWGILAYMLFQYWAFADPFAFAQTQQHWALRPSGTTLDKCITLLSLEPIWSTYDPTDVCCFWQKWRPACPVFNCQFMNPIYFLGTTLLIGVGVWRRWLSSNEILLSLALLVIPYITRAYENSMCSHGRYAAAVFPVYLVVGQLLTRLPAPYATGILVLSGFFMGSYAALFSAGFPFF